MEPFFKETQSFSSSLLKFARQYSKEKKPNFFKCHQVYLKNKATNGLNNTSNHSESNIMNISDDDLKGIIITLNIHICMHTYCFV